MQILAKFADLHPTLSVPANAEANIAEWSGDEELGHIFLKSKKCFFDGAPHSALFLVKGLRISQFICFTNLNPLA